MFFIYNHSFKCKDTITKFPSGKSKDSDYPQDTSIVAISFKFGRAAYPVMICKPLMMTNDS